MSERKVLTKYYPPDFDPSALKRQRGPKQAGPKSQTVRLMAPFSMKCMTCGEFIYKGRKFNARKSSPEEEKYLSIQIHHFSIRCTRCSAEIVFRTDPKNQDYSVVKGAKRNIEPWRQQAGADETDEQRLDRLEAEEAEEAEQDRMQELEAKTVDAKREMDVADALDEIRTRNARLERADRDGEGAAAAAFPRPEDEERLRQDEEDRKAAEAAFAFARRAQDAWEQIPEEAEEEDEEGGRGDGRGGAVSGPSAAAAAAASDPAAVSSLAKEAPAAAAAPSFKKQVKKKKDHAALLGIKKKPSLV